MFYFSRKLKKEINHMTSFLACIIIVSLLQFLFSIVSDAMILKVFYLNCIENIFYAHTILKHKSFFLNEAIFCKMYFKAV